MPKLIGHGNLTVDRPRKKLYFALLNHGWLRREFAAQQLEEMKTTPGVEFAWENPDLTWGHPIYSNRNAIVKRFLSTDADFLMMQDNDIIPLHNPAELVWADRDVIGCPAKVRQRNNQINWVAYVEDKTREGYCAVDMAYVPSDADLLPVDVVGTGLILIKRKVLETVKSPFTVENDEYGCLVVGTDFAFCKRAKEAGFEIFTTPHRTCEHIKEVGLNEMMGYDDCDYQCFDNSPYGMAWGNMVILQKDWRFIKDMMTTYGVKKVLEFGAGLSSLLMSESAEVVSYDTDEAWAKEIQGKAGEKNQLKIEMWDGVDKTPIPNGDGKFDMVFIDGPKNRQAGGPGRAAAFEAAAMTGTKLILTHDSGRRDELEWAKRYLSKDYTIKATNGPHQRRCVLWEKR